MFGANQPCDFVVLGSAFPDEADVRRRKKRRADVVPTFLSSMSVSERAPEASAMPITAMYL
jgi:hypothetical protein